MIDRDPAAQDSPGTQVRHRATKPLSASRRRILVTGGALAPVVLTLASRPVLGGDCISPSMNWSTARSHSSAKLGVCTGRSPGYWKNNTGEWPVPLTTIFYDVFTTEGATHFYNGDGSKMTLLQVLNLNGTADPQMVAAHFAAAYLAIMKGWVAPVALDLGKLQLMWSEWAVSGHYTPTAGAAPWDGEQIKRYLVTNYIAGEGTYP